MNEFPYIRRNIFVAVYKQMEQSPHSEGLLCKTADLTFFSTEQFVTDFNLFWFVYVWRLLDLEIF